MQEQFYLLWTSDPYRNPEKVMQESGLVITMMWISKHNLLISWPITDIHFYTDTRRVSTFKNTMSLFSLLTSQYYN